jgi:hypothetical protein
MDALASDPLPSTLLNFSDLIAKVAPDFAANSKWKMVRHIDTRPGVPDLEELFRFNRPAVEFYQSIQSSDVFKSCEGIFSFLGLPGSKALFIGAYRVVSSSQIRLEAVADVPAAFAEVWKTWELEQKPEQQHMRYVLEPDERFRSLELRAVIDWGKGALAWHQWELNKPISELREGHELAPCPDYEEIEVSLAKLGFIYTHENANSSWKDRLSAVGGIYLLTDHRNKKLYVGQANGADGFWGRWRAYSDGKSGNVAVDEAFDSGDLRPDETTMSVLQVIRRGAASKDAMNRMESAWKRRLQSVVAGYNRNA